MGIVSCRELQPTPLDARLAQAALTTTNSSTESLNTYLLALLLRLNADRQRWPQGRGAEGICRHPGGRQAQWSDGRLHNTPVPCLAPGLHSAQAHAIPHCSPRCLFEPLPVTVPTTSVRASPPVTCPEPPGHADPSHPTPGMLWLPGPQDSKVLSLVTPAQPPHLSLHLSRYP